MLGFLISVMWSHAQQGTTAIYVLDREGRPLKEVVAQTKKHKKQFRGNIAGVITLTATVLPDSIRLSHIGYTDTVIYVQPSIPHRINMPVRSAEIEEVLVNVGMYSLPKERSTGSFGIIDNELLNRSPSMNILERMEGVVEGVVFDRTNLDRENQSNVSPQIRLRGLSTIESNRSPLIIVDNFPYEGDISSINPQDVESMTVLKDAAATSIWGARAGNGVIVITMKKGRFEKPLTVSFSSLLTLRNKPDLYYSPAFLESPVVIAIEEELFDRKHYLERPQTPIPLYTEWLIKQRDGVVHDEEFERMKAHFANTDTRTEALKYLYRNESVQSYNLSLSGGGERYAFRWSASRDRTRATIIGDDQERFNINASSTVRLGRRLAVSTELWYSVISSMNNGIGFSDIRGSEISIAPYFSLRNADGTSAATVRGQRYAYQESAVGQGLQDWLYRPLDERNLIERQAKNKEIRVVSGLDYDLAKWLRLSLKYQYTGDDFTGHTLYSKDSYYVRDLVNRYTQPDGTMPIPFGSIMRHGSPQRADRHSGRMQLIGSADYDSHQLDYLVGADISDQTTSTFPFQMIYNYDEELLTGTALFDYTRSYSLRPTSSGRISPPGQGHSIIVSRALSYYANANYSFMQRYRLSGSVRWDAANIYGVKTNQRGVPLWSVGALWDVGAEKFMQNVGMNMFKLRATYGASGNSNPSVSVYPIIAYGTDAHSNLQSASLRNVGNPSLRWEKVKTTNIGMDIGVFGNRISGSLEYYHKLSEDLIGVDLMDPTTGIIDGITPMVINRVNYATLRTNGWDIHLRFKPLTGMFKWNSNVILSKARNEVVKYNTNYPARAFQFIGSRPPVVDESLDVMYAYPWHGLDNTGQPIIYVNGERSTDYIGYYNNYLIDDLVRVGESVPPLTGSWINNFSWKDFSLGFAVQWKTGHFFKRTTMPASGELNGNYHRDYFKRWATSGDELWTGVLPKVTQSNSTTTAISSMHGLSEFLFEHADLLRVRDAFISYNLDGTTAKFFKNIQMSVIANHLGLLWRANKEGLDPDYPNATYPPPRSFTFRLTFNL